MTTATHGPKLADGMPTLADLDESGRPTLPAMPPGTDVEFDSEQRGSSGATNSLADYSEAGRPTLPAEGAWGPEERTVNKGITSPYAVPSAASSTQAGTPPGRAARWHKALIAKLPAKDAYGEPFSTWSGELNEPNQRVIHVDCQRTRAEMEYYRNPAVRAKMEAMLTCWCFQQQARYKQGLNEVLAPFLHLQTEPDGASPSDDEVFACFTVFLRRFVPFFDNDDFVQLQCAFVFFRRLLLYHHPDLHNHLVERGISPDMFCTPWFLTLFASKTPIRLTLQLWDRYLERGESQFFVFLAVAVLANAQQAVFSAERSALPEILTSLGIANREELERLWSVAESLHNRTPATFSARLRRNLLRRTGPSSSQDGSSSTSEEPTNQKSTNLLERLEQEKCFFILPDDVVGHCYPSRPGEARQTWQPPVFRSWRLIVLDLRPLPEFEAARLPTALHFDPAATVAHGNPQGRGMWATGRRLLQQLGTDSTASLEEGKVFEALKATLGEGWVCDREAHICLLGSVHDGHLVRSLYEVLTRRLTLRHVSVASGGFEAVVACTKKHGLEIIRSGEEPSPRTSEKQPTAPISQLAGVAGLARRPLASGGLSHSSSQPALPSSEPSPRRQTSHDEGSIPPAGGEGGRRSILASAWSGIKKVAHGVATARTGDMADIDISTTSASADADLEGHATGTSRLSSSMGPPAVRDRPGNWPAGADLSVLPRLLRSDVADACARWPCLAITVRCPDCISQCGFPAESAWEGCDSILLIAAGNLVCIQAGDSRHALVLADFDVGQVLRVTSKKHNRDVLLFYFRVEATSGETGGSDTANSSEAAPDPAMVLYFKNGSTDAHNFIEVLRASYSSGDKSNSATPREHLQQGAVSAGSSATATGNSASATAGNSATAAGGSATADARQRSTERQ